MTIPATHNWIDTQGYPSGVLTFRNVHARHVPDLRTKVVELGELAQHMPADSKTSSREDRVAELHARFDAIRRRYRI